MFFVETRFIEYEYEDQLETDITDGMFQASEIIDGVRMYPFVLADYGKYYLEKRHATN